MGNWSENGGGIAKAAIFAIPCWIGAFVLFLKPEGGLIGSFGVCVLGAALLVLGATIMGIPFARLLAEPAGNLFLPRGEWKHPLPIYSRPRAFRARKEYAKAVQAYDELSRNYPRELSPYLEMLEIAAGPLKDPELAHAVFVRGMKQVKDKKQRKRLARLFGELYPNRAKAIFSKR